MRIYRQVAAMMFVGSMAVIPASAQSAATAPSQSAISASGQGEAKVTPDRASIMVNVQTRAVTAAAAAADNAQKTRSVLDALGKLGLSKEQLATEGYNVYPELKYDKDGGEPRVTGYVVTNTVRAETKRVDQAGAIVDAALGAGANIINGLTFYASSIDEARRDAIGIAVSSARADAEVMASAAGGSLGTLLELSTNGPTVPPRPMFDMSARTKMAVSTPINPGQQTISVYVSARWQYISK